MTEHGELSEDVKRLLVRLESVEEIEILSLLARRPGHSFSAAEIAYELNISRSVERTLDRLASLNLVDVRLASSLVYRYAVSQPDTDRTVRELLDEYDRRRLRVVDSLGTPSPLRTFADAFRFRRKRGRNG